MTTGARGASRTVTAILLIAVCQLVPATGQPFPLAALAPQTLRSPLTPLQTSRVKDLAPGALLVAARELADPNFVETVIVLVDHSEEGTMGLVVNRQTGVPLSRVFQKLPQAQRQSAPVYIGGPVSATSVQALVRSPKTLAQGRQVADDLHVIGTRRALEERLGSTTDQARFRVYLGYAGWAAGQLAQEVGVGAWHIFPADADVVFDPDPDTLWDRQIRQTELLLARTAPSASERGIATP
jgi:putative transcriptional regulator